MSTEQTEEPAHEVIIDNNYYSENWKQLETLLIYHNPNFQFKSSVLLLELDDCIFKRLSVSKYYNTMNASDFEIYSEELIAKLKKQNSEHSIVICSNQIMTSKVNIDLVKNKIEKIANELHLDIIALIATKPNLFMKPHTGMWKMLNSYYKRCGKHRIQKALMISDEGGLYEEVTTKNKTTKRIYSSDIDRAFVNNIQCGFTNIAYTTIGEYLGYEALKHMWSKRVIPPDKRHSYIRFCKKHATQDITDYLVETFGIVDQYVILVAGAPRVGKTTFIKMFKKQWDEHLIGKTNQLELLEGIHKKSTYKKFTKLLEDRFSVILEGGCHVGKLRKQYVKYTIEKNIPTLFLDVNCGLEMAKIFNHVYVEQSKNELDMLYDNKKYIIYRSNYTAVNERKNYKYLHYIPEIKDTALILRYRY